MPLNLDKLPPMEIGNVAGAADRRAQALKLAQERAHQREQRLQQQISPQSTPQARIMLWEELHALPLPRSRTHPLLRVIATQTALTMQDVRAEQERRRLERPIAAP
jgi:hypothetical protein